MTTRLSPYIEGAGRLMITDGGPHDAETWAVATAEHIFRIGPAVSGARLVAARKVLAAVVDALTPHHRRVQDGERASLAAKGDAHFAALPGPQDYLDDAIAALRAAVTGSEWEAHYARPEVEAVLRQELAAHFATAQDIERSWHADRNPAQAQAQAWKAARHPGAAPLAN